MAEPLDAEIKSDQKPQKPASEVVIAALRTVDRYRIIRDEKETRVQNARELYLSAIEGVVPKRINSLPAYILNQLVELVVTLIKVPDIRLLSPTASEEVLILMSKYLEKKVRDGGFHDLMETGWSGYHELSLTGVIYVNTGVKTDGDVGMPEYRLLPSKNVGFNPSATRIRSNTSGDDAFRFYYLDTFELETARETYPGILDVAKEGDIPSESYLEKMDEMTDEQKSEMDTKRYIQVLKFYDRLLKIESTIVGSTAYEYKTLRDADYEWIQTVNGRKEPVVPVAMMGFFPKPEGLEGVGVGEMFYNLAYNVGLIGSSQLNNATDNYNAPAIINIPGVAAGKIFQQIEMAKKARKELGESAALAFDPKETGGQGVGQQNVSYLRNDFPAQETEALIVKIEKIILRLGFNLDFFFTDSTKTLGQTELDMNATNSTISKIQARNTSFYRFIFQFAIDKIIENGDENSQEPFGNDVEIDIEGKEMTAGELPPLEDGTEELITEGEMVELFRKHKVEIEVDTKTGVVFNELLEERNLLRRLNRVPDGSTEQMRILNALSFLSGGKKVSKEDIVGAEGQLPQTQGASPEVEFEK